MNRPIPSAEAPPTLNFLPDLLLQESWQRSCCCCQDFISQEHFEQTPFSESGTRSSATHIRPSTIKCHSLQYHWLASTRFTARTLKISSEEQQSFRLYLSAHLPLFAAWRYLMEPLIFSTSEKRRSRFAPNYPASPPRSNARQCMLPRTPVSTSGSRRAISIKSFSGFAIVYRIGQS